VDGERVQASDRWQTEEKEKQVAAAAKIPEIFEPHQVAFVFDVLAMILSFIYSYILKYDFKIIFAELSFEEDQKIRMSKPLARICSKYAPSEWAGMTAEIELVTTLGVWMVAGFGRAKQAVQKDQQEKARTAQEKNRNRVTQMPQAEPAAIPL
jgi:hypothetical protein